MPDGSPPLPTNLKPSQPRPLTVDVLLTLTSKVSVLVLTAASGVIVARELGPSGRGAIAVAFAFTLLLVQLGVLGLHSSNTYYASRDPGQLSRILTNSVWFAFGMGLLLVAAGVVAHELLPALLRGLDAPEVAVVLIGIPAALAMPLLQGLLLAEGRMVAYNGVELGVSLAGLVGLTMVLLVFSGGVLSALVVFVAVNVAGALTFIFLLRHHVRGLRQFDFALFITMLRYGFRVYLAALMAYLIWRANLLLVNSYLGSSEAGQLSIAIALGETIHLLPTVVALNLFPRISRGDDSSDTGAVFRSLALIFGLLCVAIIPIVGPVITLLYGTQFSGAIGIWYWLLPGIYAYGMVSVLSYHFAGRGFPLSALLVWIVGAAVNFAIALPLLSAHKDVAFAAIAVSVSYGVVLALHVRMFAKEVGGYGSLVPRPRETLQLTQKVLRAVFLHRRATAAPEPESRAQADVSAGIARAMISSVQFLKNRREQSHGRGINAIDPLHSRE